MQDRIFYAICFGFLSGVLLRSFIFVNFYVVVLIAIISLAVFLFFFLTREKRWGIIISIFIFLFVLGILRFQAVDAPAPEVFESNVSEKTTLAGEIVDDPVIAENNQKIIVEIKEGGAETKVLLSAGFEQSYKYGDEIKFEGTLKKPENFTTEQGKIFDYVNYLRKDGIRYVMIYPEIEIISRGNGNALKHILFFIKGKFLEKINFAVQAPESLLLAGLLIGERAAFNEELRQDFIDTGTIHIVALSGYNVTIVAEWFMKFFAFLPINWGLGIGVFSIFLFVLMTGANSTAVRAGIMAVLALLARATGRDYDVTRALVLACVLMVILNPFVLAYDVSFQLSFTATIAVIFFTPKLEKYFTLVTKSFGLRDVMSVTTAAYIFVLPLILYKMGNFSLVALPTNFFVLPLIPLTMAAGFLTSFAGILWYGFAVPFGFIAYLFLHYELEVIGFLADFPFASFTIPYFPLTLTLAIYVYFIYLLFGRNIKIFFTQE